MSELDDIVVRNFDLKREEGTDVRDLLVRRLRWIIDHQMARLPHYLYQLDVSEVRVNEAFAQAATAAEVPERLADLILERVTRTLEHRQRFRCGD